MLKVEYIKQTIVCQQINSARKRKQKKTHLESIKMGSSE